MRAVTRAGPHDSCRIAALQVLALWLQLFIYIYIYINKQYIYIYNMWPAGASAVAADLLQLVPHLREGRHRPRRLARRGQSMIN